MTKYVISGIIGWWRSGVKSEVISQMTNISESEIERIINNYRKSKSRIMAKLTKEEVLENLKIILFRTNFTENIKLESSQEDDLALDSMDLAEVVMECEKEYRIVIEDAAIEKIKTVQDMVDLISDRIPK